MAKNKSSIQTFCFVGLFTAVLSITAQIAIPLPFGVPLTLQTFAVSIIGIILGAKNGALTTFIYMLLGAIGLPVFANFRGGFQTLFGQTGGFILSFPIMAYIIGIGTELRSKWKYAYILGLILGTTSNLICGTLMFCYLTHTPFFTGAATCILPFIPSTILSTLLSSVLGSNIRRRLQAFL